MQKPPRTIKALTRTGLIALSLMLGVGCATLQPTFEQSHQMFLERTMQNLELGKIAAKVLPAGATVALVSLETGPSPDLPVVATLEDQLVSSLVGAGIHVLERDPEGLAHLMRETESGDRYSLLYRNHVGQWPVTAVTTPARKDPDLRIVMRPTKLDSTEYLVTYRILELGLLYKDDTEQYQNVVREGRVRLHVRITEADSGRILFANNIDGAFEDRIRKVLLDDLEDYHYSFFSHEMPLQPNNDAKSATIPKIHSEHAQ